MRQVKQLRIPLLRAVAAAALSLSLGAAGDELIVGATTHFAQGKGLVAGNLQVFKESGMLSPRDEIYWFGEEKEKGVYSDVPHAGPYFDAATELGLEPLLLFNGGNKLYDNSGYPKAPESIAAYAKFCAHYAAMYEDKIHLFQIWNEWDLGISAGISKADMDAFGGKDAAKAKLYVDLLAQVYPAVKAASPKATIIANSATSIEFLEETLKVGVIKHCDGLVFHRYEHNSLGEARKPERFVEYIAKLDQLVKRYNGGEAFPLYITETGWSMHVGSTGATEDEVADNIARAFLYIKSVPAVKGLWWYDFQDDGLDPKNGEDKFGMVYPDLTPKQQYYAMRSIAEIVRQGKFVERAKSSDDGLMALRFKMPDGQDVLAAWSLVDNCDLHVSLKKPAGERGKLKTFVAGFAPSERDWGARDWVANRKAEFQPDHFDFTVKSRPFLVMGDLADIEIAAVKRVDAPDVRKRRQGYTVTPKQIVPCLPAARPGAPVKFGGPMDYLSCGTPRQGARDLDAAFNLTWDKDALNLTVEVEDDTMCQEHSSSDLWKGDSLQLAFQNLAKDADHSLSSQYSLALTGKGLEVFREFSQNKRPSGATPDVKFEVKRGGTKTVYTARFPLKELGFKELPPNTPFGFSLLVNDNDGSGRRGFLHWGDGIGVGKDPAAYNWLVVKE